jgi:hypothetical protein
MVPTLHDASTKPWVETLEVLSKSESGDTFVPGHGDVGTTEDVWAFREYLVTLRTLVSDAQAQGKEGDALFDAVMPSLTEKYGHWDFFKEKAKSNIVETDAELRGKKRTPQAAMEK